MEINNNTDIKYAPLLNKVVNIDEQNSTAKYNNSEAIEITTKSNNDNNRNDLPDVRFSVPLTTLSSSTRTTMLDNNNNSNNNDLDESIVYKKTSFLKCFKIEKLYLILAATLSFIVLSLVIILMYKRALINSLEMTLKDQKREYDALKQKESPAINNNTNKTNSSDSNNYIDYNDNKTRAMCLTDNCILLSANIYNSLDTSVDPCEDFYEYSCGNWLKKTLIPRGYPRWSTIVSRSHANQLIVKEELEKYSFINSTKDEDNDHNLIEAEIKAVLFYKSCIDNHGNIEKLKEQPFLNIVNKFLYKNQNNTLVFNDTFNNILFDAHINFGLAAFFQMGVMDDDKNSSFNDIEVQDSSN